MYLALNFRNRLPGVVRNELDQLVAAINAMWDVQHTKDGGLKADSVTTAMLNFTAAESDSIVATINASTEGLKIDADLIQINGTVTFASGYDPTGKVAIGGAAADVNANSTVIQGGKITVNGDSTFGSGYDPTGKIATGGAAADVNANSTTIAGGKITTNSITAAQLLTDLTISNTIRSSGATALNTGTGFWLDATGTPTFRVGNPSADYLRWDGTNLTLVSTNLSINSSGVVLASATSATYSAPSAFSFSGLSSGSRASLWNYATVDGHFLRLDSYINTSGLKTTTTLRAENGATGKYAYFHVDSGFGAGEASAKLYTGAGTCDVEAGLFRADASQFDGDMAVDTNTLKVDATNHRVGVVVTSPATSLHVSDTGTSTPRGITGDQYSAGTDAANLNLRKARGTISSPSVITTGDVLGNLSMWGHDGTNFIRSASVVACSEGTIGTGAVPSHLRFHTMNAAGTLTERFRIDSSGHLLPSTTGVSNLGSTSYKMLNLWWKDDDASNQTTTAALYPLVTDSGQIKCKTGLANGTYTCNEGSNIQLVVEYGLLKTVTVS